MKRVLFFALISLIAGLLACVEKAPDQDAARPAGQARKAERFVSKGDGTVTDTRTGLIWAAQDNGTDINWDSAKAYCENFSAGGYGDWRLPTIEELRSLYDPSQSRIAGCDSNPENWRIHIVPAVDLSCYWVWSSETPDASSARYFLFDSGLNHPALRSYSFDGRVLPVRSSK